MAQQRESPPTDMAKLRFVCASGSTQPLLCHLNQTPIRPEGFPSGYHTGLISFKPDTYQIQAEHPELGSIELTLELKSGDHRTLIFYSEEIPIDEEAAKPKNKRASLKSAESHNSQKKKIANSKRELKHFILDASPSHAQRFLTILQLTPQEVLELSIFQQHHYIQRLKPIQETTKSHFRAISYQGKPLCHFEMIKNQEYQLILFQADDGTLQCIHHSTR